MTCFTKALHFSLYLFLTQRQVITLPSLDFLIEVFVQQSESLKKILSESYKSIITNSPDLGLFY